MLRTKENTNKAAVAIYSNTFIFANMKLEFTDKELNITVVNNEKQTETPVINTTGEFFLSDFDSEPPFFIDIEMDSEQIASIKQRVFIFKLLGLLK